MIYFAILHKKVNVNILLRVCARAAFLQCIFNIDLDFGKHLYSDPCIGLTDVCIHVQPDFDRRKTEDINHSSSIVYWSFLIKLTCISRSTYFKVSNLSINSALIRRNIGKDQKDPAIYALGVRPPLRCKKKLNKLQYCLWCPIDQDQSYFTNFQRLKVVGQTTQFYLAKISTLYLYRNCAGAGFYQRYLVRHFTTGGRPSSSNKRGQSSCLQGKHATDNSL